MDNYIRVFDNVIEDSLCDAMIKKFEDIPTQHQRVSNGGSQFTQLELFKYDEWKNEVKYISQKFNQAVVNYAESCNIKNQWPTKYAYESFRMKRYLPDGIDRFEAHVDVSDINNCRRFLVFFLYLNDNEGGSTSFPQLDLNTKCKKGSMLMFPPLWPWLHSGEKPIDKPKYILGSYLQYIA